MDTPVNVSELKQMLDILDLAVYRATDQREKDLFKSVHLGINYALGNPIATDTLETAIFLNTGHPVDMLKVLVKLAQSLCDREEEATYNLEMRGKLQKTVQETMLFQVGEDGVTDIFYIMDEVDRDGIVILSFEGGSTLLLQFDRKPKP